MSEIGKLIDGAIALGVLMLATLVVATVRQILNERRRKP
jgi:hypothetical protein